jgi:uncharacterized protein (TIGR03437 family)
MLKYCAFFSLCAAVALGQAANQGGYITYQAARLVLGQTTFTSQEFFGDPTTFANPQTLMGSAQGVAFGGDTLFVADSNRFGLLPVDNRVVMFTGMSQNFPQPTDELADTQRCPVCLGTEQIVLGQPDFTSASIQPNRTQSGMNLAIAVATDGVHVAIADTANNRVLLWNELPTSNNQPADLVLGQPDFTTILDPPPVNASAMRAPQGVWFSNGKFFVADTQNNRVLIWNSVPTQNNQPADVELGAPNFTTVPNADQTSNAVITAPTTLLSPTSVTSDGVHLFVADLGFSRVLIWNQVPTTNDAPANVELGQKDMVTGIEDDSTEICASNGTDSNGNPTYPNICGQTMDFPRFALSDGTRLYVADTGNDRVLVWNTIPTVNDQEPDVILGEPDEFTDVITSNESALAPNLQQSGSNVLQTPGALAWDGQNLYVTDPSNFRVLVFTPEQAVVQQNGVVNSASLAIYAIGTVAISGTITAGDTITVTIDGTNYTYTVVTGDTFDSIVAGLVTIINTSNNGNGDPNVIASSLVGFGTLQLTARQAGTAGNSITLATSVNTDATETATASDTQLDGGGSASTLAPGTLVAIQGSNLSDNIVSTPAGAQVLPTTLRGVQVYVDGIRAPIIYVSPTQINAQIPFEVVDANSSSLFVRTVHNDGSVTVTDAIGLPITTDNPGIFAMPGPQPQVAIAYHGSSYATATISVDGTIEAGDIASVNIGDNAYTYTVQDSDTLASIRDGLIALIDNNPNEVVTASAAVAFTRIRLQAKVPGPEGDGIQITGSSTGPASGSAGDVTITALNTQLCCANVAGTPITQENPAQAGETIYVYATGCGLVVPESAKDAIVDGQAYQGPAANTAEDAVNALVGGSTATVVSAGLAVGMIGIYQVILEINSTITTDPYSQMTIAQDIYTSNIVTVPVYQPTPTTSASSTSSTSDARPKRSGTGGNLF